MAELGKVLGELVLMFGATFVCKKIFEAAGQKTIAGMVALSGYCLTGVCAVEAFAVIKDLIGNSFASIGESVDATNIVTSIVDSITEGIKNSLIK